jgi:hypothetical protein
VESHLQEVLQQLLAFLGEDGLGVELDTVDGILFVREAHDFAFLIRRKRELTRCKTPFSSY